MTSADIGLTAYEIAPDLYSDAVAGMQVSQAGLVEGSTIDLGEGTTVRTVLHFDGTTLVGSTATVSLDGGQTEYLIEVNNPGTSINAPPVVTSAAQRAISNCGDKIQVAVGKAAKVGAEMILAGGAVYAAMEVAPAARALTFVFPATRHMTRKAWAYVAVAVATMWDDVNEMREAVNDARAAC